MEWLGTRQGGAVDIHKLRCVVSLARLRNVTRAAEENYVAQSTMSSTISSVEAELGCTLFTRTNAPSP